MRGRSPIPCTSTVSILATHNSYSLHSAWPEPSSFVCTPAMSGSKQRFRRISLTLGRKKKKSVDDRYMELQRDTVADQNGYHETAQNGFMNGVGDEMEQNEDDAYPEDGPLCSGTHSLRRIRGNSKSPIRFQEMDSEAKRFTLPLFGQLGRASSAHQVGQTHRQSLSSSFSNPASIQDLSISPPVSPSKTALMPQLSRTQRRASLSEKGYGKLQTYLKLGKLGEGTYATVYKGRSSITGQLVALKEIRLEHEEGAPCTAIREISLLKDLKHANIVALHDIIHTHNSLTLIFEFVKRDLKQYMDACNGMMHMNNVKLFLYQLLRGLAYCHARRVLHRDLKPQNLLISEVGDLKLADFGLARAKSVPTKTYSNEVVTLWYRPPDVLLGSTNYSDNIDMWGVGCIFFEMACGRPMFPGLTVEEQLMLIWKTLGTPTESTWPGITKNQEFMQGRYHVYAAEPLSQYAPRLDREALDLMSSLLQFQSKNRVPAKTAMRHSYFNSLGSRIHMLPNIVSIFTLPECQLVLNPGQFAGTSSPESRHPSDRHRRNSTLY